MTTPPLILTEPFPKWSRVRTDHPSVVYFMENARGDVIYVGQSGNWPRRFSDHRWTARWWPEVHLIRLLPVDPHDRADVETLHITRLEPRYNVAKTGAQLEVYERSTAARRANAEARRAAAQARPAPWASQTLRPLLSPAQACELLGLTEERLRGLMTDKRLTYYKLPGGGFERGIRFRPEELEVEFAALEPVATPSAP
jgi:hypothetical protein